MLKELNSDSSNTERQVQTCRKKQNKDKLIDSSPHWFAAPASSHHLSRKLKSGGFTCGGGEV